jgi:hypothetical protein
MPIRIGRILVAALLMGAHFFSLREFCVSLFTLVSGLRMNSGCMRERYRVSFAA